MRLPTGFRVVRSPGRFELAVGEVVRTIPAGTVASYGRVAGWAGFPGAARAVGGALSGGLEGAPWHRVVTASGRLVPGHEAAQAELLRSEGVSVRAGHVAPPLPWWDGHRHEDPEVTWRSSPPEKRHRRPSPPPGGR